MKKPNEWALSDLAAVVNDFRLQLKIPHLPSRTDFRAANREDIWDAVRHHGGMHAIEKILGIPVAMPGPRSTLYPDLETWLGKYGCPGLLPPPQHLTAKYHAAHLHKLVEQDISHQAAQDLGLQQVVKMNLNPEVIRLLYWPTLHLEIRYYEARGNIDTISPTIFKHKNRNDIAFVLELFGISEVERRIPWGLYVLGHPTHNMDVLERLLQQ